MNNGRLCKSCLSHKEERIQTHTHTHSLGNIRGGSSRVMSDWSQEDDVELARWKKRSVEVACRRKDVA